MNIDDNDEKFEPADGEPEPEPEHEPEPESDIELESIDTEYFFYVDEHGSTKAEVCGTSALFPCHEIKNTVAKLHPKPIEQIPPNQDDYTKGEYDEKYFEAVKTYPKLVAKFEQDTIEYRKPFTFVFGYSETSIWDTTFEIVNHNIRTYQSPSADKIGIITDKFMHGYPMFDILSGALKLQDIRIMHYEKVYEEYIAKEPVRPKEGDEDQEELDPDPIPVDPPYNLDKGVINFTPLNNLEIDKANFLLLNGTQIFQKDPELVQTRPFVTFYSVTAPFTMIRSQFHKAKLQSAGVFVQKESNSTSIQISSSISTAPMRHQIQFISNM
ncbi:MAG: hypothetical protein EZS28_041008 [Streblomastix strix]|uniref:Uncharacterized protein n=1 Tax=Streblomastix strix TaxID=222440 RepID=A0A5J4U188_9EUKA|nr:MAG: hypothetical protein EZS28_041008 [Streblomastix strix]